MSSRLDYLRMLVEGLTGALKALKKWLTFPPRAMILKAWFAAAFVGFVTGVVIVITPWPFILLVGGMAILANIYAIRALYRTANWFYLHGRQHEVQERLKE